MPDSSKELRFTRSRQAASFALAGVALVCCGAGLLVLRWWQLEEPPAWWIAIVPLAAGAGALVFATRLARHAFLLLSPVGLEIFPFFFPSKNFQLVPWGTVNHAEVDANMETLTVKLAGYEDAGIVISLAPIARKSRPLLARAVAGVMEKRNETAERPAGRSPS